MKTTSSPWKKIIATLVFGALLALCLAIVSRLVMRKDSEVKYGDFIDHAEEIDVLFFGSSHVINGVNPAELYAHYGITAYNMGGHGSVLQETYWELRLALQYCTPKAVVVDTYMLEKDYHYIDRMTDADTDEARASSVSQLHLNMDAFPRSALKKEALKDLISDSTLRRQFLYPFTVYHTRWADVTAEDYAFVRGNGTRNPLLGCELRYGVETKEEVPARLGDAAVMEKPTVGAEYLIKIIEECNARSLPLLLTCLPLYGTPEDERAAAGAQLIADTYGIPFLNSYADAFSWVDPHADFNDHGHLNVTGAEKVSMIIGQELRDRFALPDHRGDSSYVLWQDAVDAYAQMRRDACIETDDLYAQLNLLNATTYRYEDVPERPDQQLRFILFLRFDSDASQDEALLHLIEPLRTLLRAASPSSDRELSALLSVGDPYLYLRDGSFYECIGSTEGDAGIKTSLGALAYTPMANFCSLVREDAPEENLLDMTDHYDADVQLIVYNESGEILSHRCYSLLSGGYKAR